MSKEIKNNKEVIVVTDYKKLPKEEKIQKFYELRAKGHSFDSITQKLGGSKSTWRKREVDNHDEINNYRMMIKETMLNKFKLGEFHQIKRLGEELSKIDEELAKRDLAEVSTEKLVDMKLKVLDRAKKHSEFERVFVTNDQIRKKKMDNYVNPLEEALATSWG